MSGEPPTPSASGPTPAGPPGPDTAPAAPQPLPPGVTEVSPRGGPAWVFTSCSIRGTSHERKGMPNQDFVEIACVPNGPPLPIRVAIADGHGSQRSFRSQAGSRLAVEAALAELEKMSQAGIFAKSLAEVEEAAAGWGAAVLQRWQEAVLRDIEANPFSEADVVTHPDLRRSDRRPPPLAKSASQKLPGIKMSGDHEPLRFENILSTGIPPAGPGFGGVQGGARPGTGESAAPESPSAFAPSDGGFFSDALPADFGAPESATPEARATGSPGQDAPPQQPQDPAQRAGYKLRGGLGAPPLPRMFVQPAPGPAKVNAATASTYSPNSYNKATLRLSPEAVQAAADAAMAANAASIARATTAAGENGTALAESAAASATPPAPDISPTPPVADLPSGEARPDPDNPASGILPELPPRPAEPSAPPHHPAGTPSLPGPAGNADADGDPSNPQGEEALEFIPPSDPAHPKTTRLPKPPTGAPAVTASEIPPFPLQPGEDGEIPIEWFVAYGSTILATVVTERWVFISQLGDGDILLVDNDGKVTRPLPQDKKLFANETTSLCCPDADSEFRLKVLPVEHFSPALILLSTDGYANSFQSDEGFLQVGSDIWNIICECGFDVITRDIESWLRDASREGSGDDISVGILCRADLIAARSASPA
ncbi:hypothetical protein DB346_05770 [Verrucomicrobia bacterium LW23]|nr:hypothetical protein DB346_05770 [Verrucomicrobia bacterium LW23]